MFSYKLLKKAQYVISAMKGPPIQNEKNNNI